MKVETYLVWIKDHIKRGKRELLLILLLLLIHGGNGTTPSAPVRDKKRKRILVEAAEIIQKGKEDNFTELFAAHMIFFYEIVKESMREIILSNSEYLFTDNG